MIQGQRQYLSKTLTIYDDEYAATGGYTITSSDTSLLKVASDNTSVLAVSGAFDDENSKVVTLTVKNGYGTKIGSVKVKIYKNYGTTSLKALSKITQSDEITLSDKSNSATIDIWTYSNKDVSNYDTATETVHKFATVSKKVTFGSPKKVETETKKITVNGKEYTYYKIHYTMTITKVDGATGSLKVAVVAGGNSGNYIDTVPVTVK